VKKSLLANLEEITGIFLGGNPLTPQRKCQGLTQREPFDRLKALGSIEGLSQTLRVNGSNGDLPPVKETVSQYEKTDFSEKRERQSGGKDLR